MSQIHKVIRLNEPLKIFDFTPIQLLLMLLCTIVGLIVASKIPSEWKLDKIPMGVIFFILIICAGIVFVKASELKPGKWWFNLFLYRLRLMPTAFIPHPEPSQVYPDPDIIEAKKKDDHIYVHAD